MKIENAKVGTAVFYGIPRGIAIIIEVEAEDLLEFNESSGTSVFSVKDMKEWAEFLVEFRINNPNKTNEDFWKLYLPI